MGRNTTVIAPSDKEFNLNFWKTCNYWFNRSLDILPKFSISDCTYYFRTTLSCKSNSDFKTPAWFFKCWPSHKPGEYHSTVVKGSSPDNQQVKGRSFALPTRSDQCYYTEKMPYSQDNTASTDCWVLGVKVHTFDVAAWGYGSHLQEGRSVRSIKLQAHYSPAYALQDTLIYL